MYYEESKYPSRFPRVQADIFLDVVFSATTSPKPQSEVYSVFVNSAIQKRKAAHAHVERSCNQRMVKVFEW